MNRLLFGNVIIDATTGVAPLMLRVKVKVAAKETWIDALPSSLRHEFSTDELEYMKQQVRPKASMARLTRLIIVYSMGIMVQFSAFDLNDDGALAADEVESVMKSMGIHTTVKEVSNIFK